MGHFYETDMHKLLFELNKILHHKIIFLLLFIDFCKAIDQIESDKLIPITDFAIKQFNLLKITFQVGHKLLNSANQIQQCSLLIKELI